MANTLYEFYKGQGQALPSIGARSQLYAQYGLGSAGSYSGTAAQNNALLAKLQAGSPGGSSPAPSSPAPVNVPQINYTPPPSASEQLKPYLEKFQQDALENRKKAESFLKTDEEIQQEIDQFVRPNTPVPTAPSLVELFNTLRTEQDVTALEQQMAALKAAEEEVLARRRERLETEEGRPVAANVIAGRQSEVDRQEQKELDFIGRQIKVKADQLNTSYSLINTIINLTGQDYQNAITAYNTEFNQNLQMYSILTANRNKNFEFYTGEARRSEDKAFELGVESIKLDRDDYYRQQDTARANLQIYTNLITKGNLTYAQIPAETKVQISKLEVQAGLGVGFLASVTRDNPNGEIKSVTTRQDATGMKYADMIIVNPDGSIRVESKALGKERLPDSGGGSSEMSEAELARDARSKVSSYLNKNKNSYGHVSPATWSNALSAWTSDGFSAQDFFSEYGRFADPNRGDFQQVYGFNPYQ